MALVRAGVSSSNNWLYGWRADYTHYTHYTHYSGYYLQHLRQSYPDTGRQRFGGGLRGIRWRQRVQPDDGYQRELHFYRVEQRELHAQTEQDRLHIHACQSDAQYRQRQRGG